MLVEIHGSTNLLPYGVWLTYCSRSSVVGCSLERCLQKYVETVPHSVLLLYLVHNRLRLTHPGMSSLDERSALHSSIASQSSSKDDAEDEESKRQAPSTWRSLEAPLFLCCPVPPT